MGRPSKNDELLPDAIPPAPSPKEAIFLRMYIEHGDVAQAARESGIYKPRGAGYRSHAIEAANRVLTRFQPQVKQMMEVQGLSFPQLLKRLNDGLDAESSYAVGRGEDRHIETYADHRSRSKYLEMGFKLLGSFPTTPAVVKIGGDDNSTKIAIQHFEAVKNMSPEERDRRFAEMIEAAKRGPLRIAR